MKVLHIVAGAGQGGAETICLDAVKALHDNGVEQVMIGRPHQHYLDALHDRGIRHHEMSFNPLLKFWQKAQIDKIIAAEQPDLIHSWMNRGASFTPRQKDIPVLGWFGGYYDLKNYGACDFYMGVTRDIVRHIKEHVMRPDRAYVGHTFGTLEPSPAVTKADYGIPEDAQMVLLLSRMHWKKGVDLLMDAGRDLPGVYFLMAGDGPDLEKYKAMAKELGVDDRTVFPGWCDNRSALLDIADVCVLPSRYEPFGTVIAEAWFAQTPLVATRADGARQYVTDREDGMLVDIDDRDGLVAALDAALNDKKLAARIVKGGTKTYNELFSREVVTKTMISSYEEMITRYREDS
ncbi:MAG: glycosyltransferase [Alphaproteobacteria bacterium]|nr:glycosyltransferase [Alphaproteobacteria bacterium]